MDSTTRNEQIAARAYDLYQQRGGEDGYALNDWLLAEQEWERQNPAARDEFSSTSKTLAASA